jgi:aquaporin Z
VTNTSVNPARSTGVALFAGPELVAQLWLFWVAPILGALLIGWFYNSIFAESKAEPDTLADQELA